MADLNLRFDVRLPHSLLRWTLAIAMLLIAVPELDSENVTLSTYYPAPSGIYTQMITTGQTILSRDSSLVSVGSAQPSPGAALDVTGAVITRQFTPCREISYSTPDCNQAISGPLCNVNEYITTTAGIYTSKMIMPTPFGTVDTGLCPPVHIYALCCECPATGCVSFPAP